MASTQGNDRPVSPTPAQADTSENFLTILEVAERLKVNEDTVRRLFVNEPGVLVICEFPGRPLLSFGMMFTTAVSGATTVAFVFMTCFLKR